jgi:hypothetical protein
VLGEVMIGRKSSAKRDRGHRVDVPSKIEGDILLDRETEETVIGEFATQLSALARSEASESLVELNAQCLELLSDQARAQPPHVRACLRPIAEIWPVLDAGARRRAAACPYLLLDVGFSDPTRWCWFEDRQINDLAAKPYKSFFTVPRTSAVTQQVFMYAWHLAQSHDVTAQILLGIPLHCTHLISGCTLPRIHDLAEQHPDWIRPRWLNQGKVWRGLLVAAASGEGVALENARMHGLQIIAGEWRAAQLQRAVGATGPRSLQRPERL